MAENKVFPASSMHKLDDPERLEWLPPGEILEALELRKGMAAADLGAGSGYFTLPIAEAVGPPGKVYAVDSQPAMLDRLREKLSVESHSHIQPVQGDAAGTGLPDACCDLVLMANLLHELPDPVAALNEAKRLLRDGGRLAILDWRTDVNRPPGPPMNHRISLEEAVVILERADWSLQRKDHIGRYSYLLILTATDESQQS
jgi:ubiquinone/menaquinone biosynthesis C-methylase UbiE